MFNKYFIHIHIVGNMMESHLLEYLPRWFTKRFWTHRVSLYYLQIPLLRISNLGNRNFTNKPRHHENH